MFSHNTQPLSCLTFVLCVSSTAWRLFQWCQVALRSRPPYSLLPTLYYPLSRETSNPPSEALRRIRQTKTQAQQANNFYPKKQPENSQKTPTFFFFCCPSTLPSPPTSLFTFSFSHFPFRATSSPAVFINKSQVTIKKHRGKPQSGMPDSKVPFAQFLTFISTRGIP